HQHPGISEQYKSYQQLDQASDALKNLADKTVNRITNKVADPSEYVSQAGYKGSTRVYDDGKVLRSLADPKMLQATQAVLDNLSKFSPEIEQAAKGLQGAAQKQAFSDALEAKLKTILPKGDFNANEAEQVFKMLGEPKELAPKLEQIQQTLGAMDHASTPLDRVLAAKRVLGQPIDKDLAAAAKYQHYFDVLNKVADKPMMGYNPIRIGTAFAKLAQGNVLGAAR